MNRSLKSLDIGSKLIIISSAISFVSLFLPWNHKLFDDMNAFTEGEFILYLPYLYPLILVLRRKQLNFTGGIIACLLPLVFTSILLGIYIIDSYQNPLFGMYIFLASSVLLLIGFIKTTHSNPSE